MVHGCLLPFDDHCPHFPGFDVVDVVELRVAHQLPRQLPDDLADLNRNRAVWPHVDSKRFYRGVDLLPLTEPVRADRIMPRHVAPFPAIRPGHVGMQMGQHGIDVPGVEVLVKLTNKGVILHGVATAFWSVINKVVQDFTGYEFLSSRQRRDLRYRAAFLLLAKIPLLSG